MRTALCLLAILFWACSDEHKLQLKVEGAEALKAAVLVEGDFSKHQPKDVYLGQGDEVVPVQWDSIGQKFWFRHKPSSHGTYWLGEHAGEKESPLYSAEKRNGSLELSIGGKSVLSYKYTMENPPKGIDGKYAKSGFIHPLRSPKGDTLTRIQPPDHYHHYGIWGPWTKTTIEGREVDFWNLVKGQGTVHFKEFLQIDQGPVYSGFVARQEHLDFGAEEKNRLAMIEDLSVRVWKADEKVQDYIVDYTSTIHTPLTTGINLEAYRYGGGLGFRATERWHKDNSWVLTSEGKDRLTADGTTARWCVISGENSERNGVSGILFMCHPDNWAFPEPMRVWPVDANEGRGDMFFEFCPIRNESFFLEKGIKHQLKYRMLVFEGQMDKEKAENYWQAFASPNKVSIVESK